MSDTISAGKSAQETTARIQARKLGLHNASVDIANVRTYVDEYTKISKENNWETMSLSTAQNSALTDAAYFGAGFDGRYIYYCPYYADNFLRFDTTKDSITVAGNWEQMSMSTAQGGVALDSAFNGVVSFDGRYMYYAPWYSNTFVRFDTKGTSFATAADWENMSMSTAQGSTYLDAAYISTIFDGRYVYYSSSSAATFLRFDTQGTSFTTAADWQRMNMSTAQGAADLPTAYYGTLFDGRYVYYVPQDALTFLRFDTQGTSFTTTVDWETMSASTAQGAAGIVDSYDGGGFDGRYIYYCPSSSESFIRFDTQGTSFTTATDWQKMNMSTAMSAAWHGTAFSVAVFDGRYMYFAHRIFALRFDTQGTSFSTYTDWSAIRTDTAIDGAAGDYHFRGAAYDGKYIYYTPQNLDTIVRILASPSEL